MVLEAARASAFESRSYSLQLSAWMEAYLKRLRTTEGRLTEGPRTGLGLGRAAGQCRGKSEGKKLQGPSSLGIKSPAVGWL